eukprot:TRINITY_DN446_c0_g1_i1.p2 TRINITY_DN446_c0_g1~~TRINITY_DN446_c0_g1_i1.p2  ORF type:complete len:79 (-),score=9.41 TRINITY_DN446_c0_g1_i1:181-417(-)
MFKNLTANLTQAEREKFGKMRETYLQSGVFSSPSIKPQFEDDLPDVTFEQVLANSLGLEVFYQTFTEGIFRRKYSFLA